MMPLFEKIQSGNESPNQIVVAEIQEVGNGFFPLPQLANLANLTRWVKSLRIYLTWISNKALGLFYKTGR